MSPVIQATKIHIMITTSNISLNVSPSVYLGATRYARKKGTDIVYDGGQPPVIQKNLLPIKWFVQLMS